MIQKSNMNAIPGRAVSYNTNIRRDIEDFLKSDWTVAEVRMEKYKNTASACSGYRRAAKKLGANIACIQREGRLFLIKK